MRIALDGIPLRELKTGVGHYTFELARALSALAPADAFELVSPYAYLAPADDERADERPANLRFVHSPESVLGRRWWAVGLPRYLGRTDVELFHGTNYEVPLRGATLAVMTIHDLSLLLYPETHPARRVVRARILLPRMTRRSTLIITPTESVRREVCEHLRLEPSRVVAVPEAARALFRPLAPAETVATRQRLGVEDQFLLFVGTVEPRKNLQTLLRAFEEVLARTERRTQLVIVGREGWKMKGWSHALGQGVARERVRWVGYVTDEDLCALYSSATAFVYPSIYEGFGLPPLEAMQAGAPVVASDIPSIREVTGGAAHLFAPQDARALGRVLVSLIENRAERDHLSRAGQQRASEFSWLRTARLTREVYEEALRRQGRETKDGTRVRQ